VFIFVSSWIVRRGHAVAQWLRHYATSRKVAGSKPDEAISYIYLILLAAQGFGVYSDYNRNRKIIMFLGSKVRPVRRADNLTTICESVV
jgi:hypothetical protein